MSSQRPSSNGKPRSWKMPTREGTAGDAAAARSQPAAGPRGAAARGTAGDGPRGVPRQWSPRLPGCNRGSTRWWRGREADWWTRLFSCSPPPSRRSQQPQGAWAVLTVPHRCQRDRTKR